MPMPVSWTAKLSVTSVSEAASCVTRNSTPPWSVKRIALDNRLFSICRSRVASPSSSSARFSGSRCSKVIPLAEACAAMTSASSSNSSRGRKAVHSTINSPASIFDRSNTSVITASNCRLAESIFRRNADCCGSNGVCPSRYDSPITAFIGVRIS